MKKRLLALLLTLCMVVSLLPAQMVAATETSAAATAEVTILGNSKTFVLQKGDLADGPWPSLSFDVPVGSTLGAEGYTIVFEDNETPLGWTVNGTEALATTAEVLNYPINGATTFEAGWPGAGGGGSGDSEVQPDAESMPLKLNAAQTLTIPAGKTLLLKAGKQKKIYCVTEGCGYESFDEE